CVTELSSSFSW
nr:immunoglobulin heavy chain junction region [Macaca mulatta]MOV36162.1 immunoglobulin heavy chain junction region [Macaca mulatta]